MGYTKDHKDGICDRCEEKPAIWKVPFLYLDRNDRVHPDLGNDYHQYFVCSGCKESEGRKLKAQGMGNARWEKICKNQHF